MRQSWGVLMKDKELLWLPVLSGLLLLIVTASFVIPMGLLAGDGAAQPSAAQEPTEPGGPTWAIAGFAFYVVTYTIGLFFQAAIVAGATERLSGGDPTVRSALRAAARRWPGIVLWGLVAATVGMILRAIQDRSELLGKIVVGLVGAAWSLATFFVVPVVVLEGVAPVAPAFRRSWQLFKQTWGETVVGQAGLGLAMFLLALPVIAVCALLGSAGLVWPAVVVGALGLGLLMVLGSAMQGVYLATLYRYATGAEVGTGIDRDLVADAYRRR